MKIPRGALNIALASARDARIAGRILVLDRNDRALMSVSFEGKYGPIPLPQGAYTVNTFNCHISFDLAVE